MPNLAAAYSTPATPITTTAETLAANIPPVPLNLPGGAPQVVMVRVTVWVTTGTGVTAVAVKLRTGLNNTTTAQVAQTCQEFAIASTLQAFSFIIADTNISDLPLSGYSITVSQIGATGNGTVTAVAYEVASTP
jgi:hypothetical protein